MDPNPYQSPEAISGQAQDTSLTWWIYGLIIAMGIYLSVFVFVCYPFATFLIALWNWQHRP